MTTNFCAHCGSTSIDYYCSDHETGGYMCDECKGHGIIGQTATRSSYGNLYAGNVEEAYVIHGTCTMCKGSG